jgi:hypothetical protein
MYPESNTLPKQHTSPFRARWLIRNIEPILILRNIIEKK